MEQHNLDKKIEDKFEIIESKLRNSFQAVKIDMASISTKIQELNSLIDKTGARRVLTEFEKLKANVILDVNDIRKKTSDSLTSFCDREIKPLKSQIDKLEKKEIKSSLKIELTQELNKKIEQKFEKFEKRTEQLRKDVEGYKRYSDEAIENKFNSYKENLDKFNKLEQKLVKDSIRKQENFIKRENRDIRSDLDIAHSSFRNEIDNQTQAIEEIYRKIGVFTQEMNDLVVSEKKSFSSSLKSNVSRIQRETADELELLRRQMSYLKGRLNSSEGKESVKNEPKISGVKTSKLKSERFFANLFKKAKESNDRKMVLPKEKKLTIEVEMEDTKKNRKGFFSRLIDSLSDDSSEKSKQKPSVKLEKVKVKQTEPKQQTKREQTRSFFSSIINSLAEDVENKKSDKKTPIKAKPLVKEKDSDKGFLNKIVDSLAD
ncbi:Uncharacterised protein [uncultured archaeon]|nr:Uncharacterised protein [uncultured archaeon]